MTLRAAIVRLVAGVPMLADPTNGERGAWILLRWPGDGNATWIRAETFELNDDINLAAFDPPLNGDIFSLAPRRNGRFHGTFYPTLDRCARVRAYCPA